MARTRSSERAKAVSAAAGMSRTAASAESRTWAIKREPVHRGHAQVRDQHVRAVAVQFLKSILTVVGGNDGCPRCLEDLARERQRILIVVHDQNLDALQVRNLRARVWVGVTG